MRESEFNTQALLVSLMGTQLTKTWTSNRWCWLHDVEMPEILRPSVGNNSMTNSSVLNCWERQSVNFLQGVTLPMENKKFLSLFPWHKDSPFQKRVSLAVLTTTKRKMSPFPATHGSLFSSSNLSTDTIPGLFQTHWLQFRPFCQPRELYRL